jgi:hypothetical protein
MSGKGTRSILKRNANRKNTVKATKRIRFNNTDAVASDLKIPAYITGFNRTNPLSRALGWQTQAERAAAVANARFQKALNMYYGRHVEPYKYQDPNFIYPLKARGNMLAVAKTIAKRNRDEMELEELRNKPVENHVAINVKPATRRRQRR